MSSLLCSVCGDMATSYCHYGARVCHSCRTFFRRTSVMLLSGKMKRAFFCCLRGGNCKVDVTSRKKCNFCRFDKCKLKGMVPDLQENVKYVKMKANSIITKKNDKEEKLVQELESNKKETERMECFEKPSNLKNSFEKTAKDQDSESNFILTDLNVKTHMDLPQSVSFEFGAAEFKRLHFFVDLWHMQKVVQPVGLLNIIPILESLKNKKQFPPEVVKANFMFRENWWAQFCNGLEDFQVLTPEEKKIILRNSPLANRLCRGLYFGPGVTKNLLSIIKGMTSDKAELTVVENFLTENKINSSQALELEEWRSCPWSICPEFSRNHLDLNKEIVTWGQMGLDEVSELLTCLLILFSQEDGPFFSSRIGELFEGWRLILWRYLESCVLPWEAKEGLFKGALEMVGITREIWSIEQFSLKYF